VHRLSGVSSPANAAYTEPELSYQLRASKSKAIFTSPQLLETALEAAKKSFIPRKHVYILQTPTEALWEIYGVDGFKSVDELIELGKVQPTLSPLKWRKGQGAQRCAFLNFSSGTTGLPVRLQSTISRPR
jgi:long-subunit acyl-CoA synthetase (AMP-forming)